MRSAADEAGERQGDDTSESRSEEDDDRSVTSEELRNILKHESSKDRQERERREILAKVTVTRSAGSLLSLPALTAPTARSSWQATLSSVVTGALFLMVSSLLGAAGSVLASTLASMQATFSRGTSSQSLGIRPESSTDDLATAAAPPTDSELSRRGLGFNRRSELLQVPVDPEDSLASLMAPPRRLSQSYHFPHAKPAPSVAQELTAHVESVRLGLTPRRSKPPSAPAEVLLAVAIAKSTAGGSGKKSPGRYYEENDEYGV